MHDKESVRHGDARRANEEYCLSAHWSRRGVRKTSQRHLRNLESDGNGQDHNSNVEKREKPLTSSATANIFSKRKHIPRAAFAKASSSAMCSRSDGGIGCRGWPSLNSPRLRALQMNVQCTPEDGGLIQQQE